MLIFLDTVARTASPPDSNPLDFSGWGYLEDKLFAYGLFLSQCGVFEVGLAMGRPGLHLFSLAPPFTLVTLVTFHTITPCT
uniref:Uncharacterized protein n=1 Tax=Caenorhabditis japonica TaxID=281687 RepID=A0A8R1EDR1_CAEJA